MRKLTILAAISAFCFLLSAFPQAIIPLPLSLSNTNPFVWTNAVWWTNATVPTNIQAWQGWYALNENLRRLTNYAATNRFTTNVIVTTNAASVGDALRWNGTSFYWAP